MQDYDGVVGIYSSVNSLSDKLKDKFSQKYLDVKIFDDFSKIELSHLSYLIINLIDFKDQLFSIQNIVKNVECKVLVLYQLSVKKTEKFVTDSELQNLIKANQNLGILLVPEMLGRDVSYNSLNTSHDLIMQSILSERVKIKSDSQLVNTISINKLADRVVRDTFSFGISGQIISIIGPRKSKKTFVTKYLNIDENNIIYSKDVSETVDLYSNASVQIDFSLRLAVKNTRDFLLSTTDTKIEESLIPEEIKVEKTRERKRIKAKVKRFYKLLIFIFLISLTPFFLILVSAVMLFASVKTVFTNNGLSNSLITKSMQIANIGRNLSFGNNFIYDTSNIIYEVSSLGSEGIVLVDSGRQFVGKIMSDNLYDLPTESNNISASLDKIHTNISFLQSDVNELSGFIGKYLKNQLSKKRIDIGEYKTKIYDVKNLFSRISVLLGSEKPQKYLVLFQNNMELRPTGGFIGSFGLITMDKGRLSEIVVNDIYMADGQLKGHVDPPEPIRKHLGEGGWFLRDSNWDPNFPISAIKAEWFLEKEIGVKVDGVIAIDLNFIKRLINVTGPINLPDFGMIIGPDNLYNLIQSEVEDKFFPGSIKKTTILTSLSKSLIEEVKNLKGDKYLAFFKELYESLERRHIQVYLHDVNAQEAISKLNYSGEINLDSDCGPRCMIDGYSLIDANLGVNKANYYITRSQELNVSMSKAFVGHELLVTYTNAASPAVGNMGVYKNYARVLLPVDAKIGGVRMYDPSGEYNDVDFDLIDTDGRRELGFYFELLPNAQKKVQIVWNVIGNKFEQGGQYDLKIVKQPGTDEDNLVVNIRSTDLTLTGRSLSSYNTNLARDFKARMFFKP